MVHGDDLPAFFVTINFGQIPDIDHPDSSPTGETSEYWILDIGHRMTGEKSSSSGTTMNNTQYSMVNVLATGHWLPQFVSALEAILGSAPRSAASRRGKWSDARRPYAWRS